MSRWPVLMLALLLAGEAAAHGRSVSHSRWRLGSDGGRVTVQLAARDLARRGIAEPQAYAAERLRLLAGDEPCSAGPVRREPAAEGWLAFSWVLECCGRGARSIDNRLFMEGGGARLHFARVAFADGSSVERMFGPGDTRLALADDAGDGDVGPAARPTIGRYLALGVEHILSGWDHLAFLLGLLLLARTLRDVLTLATGFTVGHSVTLALSVLGIARPEQGAVEALIGFSIVLIATENVWEVTGRPPAIRRLAVAALILATVASAAGVGIVTPLTFAGVALFAACHFGLLSRARRPVLVRGWVASGFGLVHGFGFAGILHQLALPRVELLPALLGFNAGVELGQLLVVALLWPALRGIVRLAPGGGERVFTEAASAALAGLGMFWFVGRCLV